MDRELIELLNELRVAIPGIQFLFAFLLTVPFAQRFGQVGTFERASYFVTLVAAALASALLIAPAAQHRVLFRSRDKEELLRRANRYAYAGMLVLAIAIAAALLLIVGYLFGQMRGYLVSCVFLLLVLWWWFVQPMLQRRRPENHPGA
ncbi:MAG: hypothetical protein QOJ60_1488 [Actinomycetota bacterium]|nr:hypothetical protein [Actinomycetota bacterium]